MRKRLRWKYTAFAALACLLVFFAAGCALKPAYAEYGEEKILVKGIGEEDFYVTVNEIAELECISVDATSTNGKPTQGYGPTLATFLEQYGKTFDDYSYIYLHALDDWEETYSSAHWDGDEIMLTVSSGDEPLDERYQPLRIIFVKDDMLERACYKIDTLEFIP